MIFYSTAQGCASFGMHRSYMVFSTCIQSGRAIKPAKLLSHIQPLTLSCFLLSVPFGTSLKCKSFTMCLCSLRFVRQPYFLCHTAFSRLACYAKDNCGFVDTTALRLVHFYGWCKKPVLIFQGLFLTSLIKTVDLSRWRWINVFLKDKSFGFGWDCVAFILQKNDTSPTTFLWSGFTFRMAR